MMEEKRGKKLLVNFCLSFSKFDWEKIDENCFPNTEKSLEAIVGKNQNLSKTKKIRGQNSLLEDVTKWNEEG